MCLCSQELKLWDDQDQQNRVFNISSANQMMISEKKKTRAQHTETQT